MRNCHFLVVCFPVQGHINPSLQLSKCLIRLGAHVTFATTVLASRRMNHSSTPPTMSFITFSDGFDDENFKPSGDFAHYFSELKRCGSQSLNDFLVSSANNGRPVTFVIYSLLLSWAAKVAGTFDIPSALLFVQSATLLRLYYYYFHGYGDAICKKLNDPSSCVKLPRLPVLTCRDLPSFFSPSGAHSFLISPMREQFEFLDQQSHPKILVNTFDTLEGEALGAIGKLDMIPVGPLLPSAFLDGKDPSDASYGGDLFQPATKSYMEWLNSKANSSVVYVSFGTICVLSEEQEEEIAEALTESGYAFLWVMREKNGGEREEEKVKQRMKKAEERGKIVPWCSQLEVLSHPSVGCFMSHCGWNSTLESLAAGAAVIAFPVQVDQATNAKMIEDVWKTGVRVRANGDGMVEREDIRRCLDVVMAGGGGGEMRETARKWKEMARKAVGSSELNLERLG